MLYLTIYLVVFGLWVLIEIIKAPKVKENEAGLFMADTERSSISANAKRAD